MGEALVARYWCHICSQMVNPVMEEDLKCPFCESGFVEEMNSRRDENNSLGSHRALSLWAPILLGMMDGLSRHPRFRRQEEEEETQAASEQEGESSQYSGSSLALQRRRSLSPFLQFLQGLRPPELEISSENGRERVVFLNPFNQTLVLQGSLDSNEMQRNPPGSSIGGFFFRAGFDLLLQHLSENDPSRYGTPPAKKEAVETLPAVTVVAENLQCSICLDDFHVGSEAKEMPCNHKFHCGCIVPWLERHSTCPVCRFQLPADGSKAGPAAGNSSTSSGRSHVERGDQRGRLNGENGTGGRLWVPVPWPFNGLFSLSGPQGGDNSSSAAASATASESATTPAGQN